MGPMTDAAAQVPQTNRPRLSGDERRQAILAAAREEFARVGYQGASTARIARRADCSEPMLYKHFAGKQAIFVAALDATNTMFERQFAAMLEPEGSVVELATAYLETIMHDAAFVQMLQMRMLAVSIADQPDVRAVLDQMDATTRESVRSAVERGIEQGVVRVGTDPEYVMAGWQGFMLISCFREMLEAGSFSELLPHARTFIRSFAVDAD